MIVHESAQTWQLVQQQHHGDLAGQIASAWGNSAFESSRRRSSLVAAATRHDDGWSIWEQWPRLSPDARPLQFIDVNILSHLAFYRAAIVDLASHDPYAGLLVAMHAAGLYRERYGNQPGLRNSGAAAYPDEVEAFVAELEGSYPRRIEEAGVTEEERWVDYKLLQVIDRLALYFSGLPPLQAGESLVIDHVPIDYEGGETELTLTPLSGFDHSPTHARIDPYPFVESPAGFVVQRRVVDKRDWDDEAFRAAVHATPAEIVDVVVER